MAAGQRVAIQTNINPLGSHSDGATISAATSLSALAPAGTGGILIQALTQNVRYTLDNTAPTASLGFQLKAGDPPVIIPLNGNVTLKVIEETATADLQYQFLK